MTQRAKGIIAVLVACGTWGLSPLYYALLTDVPPVEVLSYRCLWSLIFFAAILMIQRRLRLVLALLRQPRSFLVTLLAAVMISVNWFGFIYAISVGQALDASLGYYIFPLMAVLLGRVVFAEQLGRVQTGAVLLAAGAVVVLAVGLGVPPWLALLLATTFSTYSLIKKKLDVGPVVSVTAEVALVAPFALVWIVGFGTGGAGGHDIGTHVLLALSGPLTATPLVLFSYAARRVRLSTIGIVQYINPTLQFCCAVFVFGEPFTLWHGIAFPLIWTALILYSGASLRQDRAARRLDSNERTSSTTVT